jgi:hypothetical protein
MDVDKFNKIMPLLIQFTGDNPSASEKRTMGHGVEARRSDAREDGVVIYLRASDAQDEWRASPPDTRKF